MGLIIFISAISLSVVLSALGAYLIYLLISPVSKQEALQYKYPDALQNYLLFCEEVVNDPCVEKSLKQFLLGDLTTIMAFFEPKKAIRILGIMPPICKLSASPRSQRYTKIRNACLEALKDIYRCR